MLSGGSTEATSLIWFAITFTVQSVAWGTVTVQVVAAGRSESGLIVIVDVPEPLTAKVCGLPLGHSTLNELVLTFTGSLKVTVMLLLGFTPVALLAGLVLETVGALSVVNE